MTHHRTTSSAPKHFVLGALLVFTAVASAQAPTTVLSKPIAEHSEAFTQPASVRELKDGRVLVADVGERRLVALNFSTDQATAVGKVGSGPLEYRLPGLLLGMGDTTLVADAMLRRFLVIGPSGSPVSSRPIGEASADIMSFVKIGQILTIDSRGRFLSETRGMKMVPGSMPVFSDTVAIVRWSKLGEKGDTVLTRIEHAEMPGMSGDQKSGIKMTVLMDILKPRDMWAVFPDGRAILLYVRDYHAEIVDAAGKRTIAPKIPFAPVALKPAEYARLEKEARDAYERGLKIGMGMASSAAGGQMPKIEFEIKEPPGAAKTRLPFYGLVAAPDGRAWVLRSLRDLNEPSLYDILDQTGRLAKRVQFPPNVTVIGFGKGVVYTVRRDEDDLRYVQKWAMP